MSDGDTDSLHLHVRIGDITIEVEGPVDEAETWFEALRKDYLEDLDGGTVQNAGSNSGSSDSSSSSGQQTDDNRQEKSRTLAEYYKNTDGLSKKDTALLTGWYLEKHEGQDDFTRPEVQDEAQSAKLKLGANVARDLGRQVKDGNLAEVDERDGNTAYHLTITGEDYVDEELLEE
jgi:hypothetical protein